MNPDTRKERRREVLEHVGDLLENRIGSSIENSALEAPVLDPEETVRPKVQSVGQEGRAGSIPAKRVWYRVPVRKGLSGDGSEYHIYLKAGDTQHLCVFFSGGG
ncbi:MAG: hypothetical protein IJV14_00365, partial [Lachnospiraceae bacterium]|nr:hypothetical protein [Lachnospiraceae bacterium]